MLRTDRVKIVDALSGYAERRSDNPLGDLFSRPIDDTGVSGDADLDRDTSANLLRGYVRVWSDRVEDEFMVGTVTEYETAAAAGECVRVAQTPQDVRPCCASAAPDGIPEALTLPAHPEP